MDRKRILIADDHPATLQRVQGLLYEDYEIVGAVPDGQSLVEAAQELRPDLIISDISMPRMTGFEAALRIREQCVPVPKLIFLTVHSRAAYVKKARSLGADGYVLKDHTNEYLAVAVSKVLSGGTYFCPQVAAL